MIVRDLGPDAVFYRFLTPRWAFVPLSGAGAAIDGGRFNRPGVEALYLAFEEMTALAECKQGSSIAPPLTLASKPPVRLSITHKWSRSRFALAHRN